MIDILDATVTHVEQLSFLMNEEDRLEAEHMGFKAHRLLWRSWGESAYRKSALVDGEVAAIWGVMGQFLGLTGNVWFVTGRKAREVSPLVFSRIYRQEVRKMLEIFPRLESLVDASYTRSVKMLTLAGFKLSEPFPVEPTGHLYRLFSKEA